MLHLLGIPEFTKVCQTVAGYVAVVSTSANHINIFRLKKDRTKLFA